MARSALLNVMVQAATRAGRSLARDFGEVENLQVSVKGPGDFVSAADRRADQILIEALGKGRPKFGFLTGESGEIEGADPSHRWIVDPVGGTANFLHGIPLFAISLALERDGELVAGVIFSPVLNELYAAERGVGAFLNDRRLRVAARRDLGSAVIAVGTVGPGHPDQWMFGSENHGFINETAGVRVSGSTALDLAWIASGRYDGFWRRGVSPWDVAAGMVIVREAGGLVSDANGRQAIFDTGTIVAGGAPIHARIVARLAAAHATA